MEPAAPPAATTMSSLAAPTGPFSANGVYGGMPSTQPSSEAAPMARPAGEPEPLARTLPRPGDAGLLGNPTLVVIGLLAVALLIANVTFSGSVRVKA